MKRWMQHTWVKIIAVALSLSLIAAAVALVLTGTTEPLRGVGETVSRPFSRFFSLVTDKIRQGGDYLKGVQALQEENRALEQEVAQLRRAARAGDLAIEENARLRSLLELQETGQDLTFTAAWVVARAPDNWKGEVTLDQGTDQGIQAGQCVVDEHGALVGRVKEVGASWANVTLLWDPGFQMAGQGTKSGVLGSLEGSLDLLSRGELALACLTEADPVSLGEEVVTFAAQGVYPSGLVVGTVMSLEEDPGGLTRSAILTPAADLNTLSQVFVVTAFWEER